MSNSSLLIVEKVSASGGIFIVEDKNQISQVEKILKSGEFKESNNCNNQNETFIEEEYLDEEYLYEINDEAENATNNTISNDHLYTMISDDNNDFKFKEMDSEEEAIIKQENENIIFEPFELTNKTKLTGKSACKYCENYFKTKEMLRKHFDNCKYLQCDKRNYICRICNKELSKKTFSNHLHESLECQYCFKSFVNPRNLKKHIKKLHNGNEDTKPSCSIMKKSASTEFELLDELIVDSDPFSKTKNIKVKKKKYPKKIIHYECNLCGRTLNSSKSLSTHMMLHSNVYQFICENCGEKFSTKSGIKKHNCVRKRKRPLRDFRTVDARYCRYCDQTFQSLIENKAHDCIYQFQSDSTMFRCRFCDIEIMKNSFNKHMKKHLDVNEYICKICDKHLSTEAALANHLTIHSGDKPYKCQKCDKSFINKALLIRHSRFHGEEIPKFICRECNREVASKYHLKIHQITVHADNFVCHLCKQRYSTKNELKHHYALNHEPYSCETCGKNFIQLRYLKMHEKIHTEVFVTFYDCNFCARKFSKRAIASHVYKKHKDDFEKWRDKNLDLI